MKKILIPIIAILGFTSCQDCKDCTVNTDITVLTETFNPYTSTSVSDSRNGVFHMFNQLTINPNYTTSDLTDFDFLFDNAVPYYELCGTELKDRNSKSFNYTQIMGDSASYLYTYTWTETWDCK